MMNWFKQINKVFIFKWINKKTCALHVQVIKDILNLEICDHLFIKRLSEPDKIDINATDNKDFVFK